MKIEFCVYIYPQEIRRVDMYLSALFSDRSRSYMQKLIETELVTVNGKTVSKNEKVRRGDHMEVIFKTEKMDIEGEDIALDIVFENEDFAVINKDPGINVHPVPWEWGRSGTMVNALLHHMKSLSVINGIERPGIVHRLDKDTSGLIMIAKNDRTMNALQKKMNKRTIKKTYLALVFGLIKEERGYIESFIGRDPHDRKRMTTEDPINPKLAKTAFTVLGHIDGKYSLVEVDLLTGRTHQIRVHLSSIGFPILGDKTYGKEKVNAEVLKKYGLSRQWLHAYKLYLNLYGVDYNFVWPLKADLLKFPIDSNKL